MMAIYRCEFKIYSRGKAHSAVAASAYQSGSRVSGRRGANGGKVGGMASNRKTKYVSAVEAAAYRSGGTLTDKNKEQTYDYTAKRGVVWSGILAPDHAPAWAHDRGKLWNAVEKREDASNHKETAQLFREALLTIPRGLTREQQIALVRSYVQDVFVSQGMIADIGLHAPEASDGLGDNPHAHVMLTLRDVSPDGFGKKRRDWNEVQWKNLNEKDAHGKHSKVLNCARDGGFLQDRRASWEAYCNAALEKAGSTERVDRRSLKARGIARDPQRKLGKAHYAKPAPWAENAHDVYAVRRFRNQSRDLARGVSEAKRPRPSSVIPFVLPLGGEVDARTRQLARSVLGVERLRGHRYARDGIAHAAQTMRWLRGERPEPDRAPPPEEFGHDR